MYFRLAVYLLFFSCCIAGDVRGQEYVFQKITVKDGLPSDYVTAMFFDSRGLFWIGTDKGLCCYDGVNMQLFDMDNQLPGNLIYSIFEDKLGNILVGGNQTGLIVFQQEAGSWAVKKTIKAGLTISGIQQDSSGAYWFRETINGIGYTFWKSNSLQSEWSEKMTVKQLNSALVDHAGNLWYASENGLRMLDNASLNHKLLTGDNNQPASVFFSGGKIAFRKDKAVKFFDADHGVAPIDSFISEKLDGYVGQYLYANGYDIFYRTDAGVLFYKNGTLMHQFEYYKKNLKAFIFTACADKYGSIYLSNFGNGILLWRLPYLRQFEQKSAVKRIIVRDSLVSFNTDNDVYEYNHKVGDFEGLKLPVDYVNFHTRNNHNKIVIASGSHVDPKQISIKANIEKFSDLSDIIFNRDETFISSYSLGIIKIRGDKIDSNWVEKAGVGSTVIERLKIDNNNLFAFTLNKGLIQLSIESGAKKVYDKAYGLLSNSVYDVLVDKDTMWVCGSRGLNKIVKNKINVYTTENGFIGIKALTVFYDKRKRLWVLSDKYLHLVIGDSCYALRSYPLTTDNAVYVKAGNYQPATNILWIGTNQQMCGVEMDAITPNYNSYQPALHSINVGTKSYASNSGVLELPFNHEAITIALVSSSFNLNEMPLIYTRLIGYNKNWEQIAPNNTLSYNKLPPGGYTLQAKTIGPDFGSSNSIILLKIKIQAPWWQRSWFIACVIVVIAIGAYAASKYFSAQKYKRRIGQLKSQQALQVERTRISRDLHDNVGSMLTVMINKLEDTPITSVLQQGTITSIARKTLAQLRDAVWALDKETMTLQEWQERSMQFLQELQTSETHIEYEFNWPPELKISPNVALHCFRIMQEACNNATRHARCSRVFVGGTLSGIYLNLIISDDGIGLDLSTIKKGYGIKNMTKRAAEINGTIEIKNNTGNGTMVVITWPAAL